MTLFHGSSEVIRKPLLSKGKRNNDYGQGFYCTRSVELAGEWATKNNTDGFINHYVLQESGLRSLDLTDGSFNILNWMALLLKNRFFEPRTELALEAKEYLIENFAVDLEGIDVIEGYRADDSYFAYAEGFIENSLPLRALEKALYLGKLGMQTVLISEKAFESLSFVHALPAPRDSYYQAFKNKDDKARATFREEIKKTKAFKEDIFVMDILREEMRGDDARLQRILPQ